MTDALQVQLLAAQLRQDAADISMYAGFLLTQLSGALPADMVDVERSRSLRDKMAGREGEVVAVRVRHADRVWSLRREKIGAAPVARVEHTVNGIVLSRDTLTVAAWADQVAQAVVEVAATSASSAAALAEVLQPKGF